MRLLLDRIPSPVGQILLAYDEQGYLRALDFHDFEARMHRLLRLHYGGVDLSAAQAPQTLTTPLRAYFAGVYDAVAAIPISTGGTPFQQIVWNALRRIPVGVTISYGALAASIGRPGASRAVGLANGANPLAIVVPCHRVIGANRSLTGFGGGLHRKRWLLEHEGVVVASERQTFIAVK